MSSPPSSGASEDDPINPQHYRGDRVMRIIEEFELSFCLGNVVKYVLREQQKAGLQDLRKAQWYLAREIAKRTSAPPAEVPSAEQVLMDHLAQAENALSLKALEAASERLMYAIAGRRLKAKLQVTPQAP